MPSPAPPVPPAPPSPAALPAGGDLLAEARLYVEWARGAAGRWLPGEAPPAGGDGAGGRAAAAVASAPVAAAVVERPAEHVPADPATWQRLESQVAGCTRCTLCATRTQTVFGSGSRLPRLVVVGEAPGAEEDRQGQPFV